MSTEQAPARTPEQEAVAGLEEAINVALLVFGRGNEELRRALLDARGNIRQALGEART